MDAAILWDVAPSCRIENFLMDKRYTRKGGSTSIVTMATSLLAVPSGPWFDRGGQGWARKYRNAVVAGGYFIFSILTGFAGLTKSIWHVVTLQGIKNAFGGAGEVVEVTALAEWFPRQQRGFALGLQHSAYPWGTLLGAIATSAILAAFGPANWRYVFFLIPLAMIPIWIGYWIFASRRRYEEMEVQARQHHLTPPLAEEERQRKAAPGVLGRTLRNPNVLVPAIASMFGIMTYTGISFWLPQYIKFVGNYSYAQAAGYSAIFTITGGVGQIVWGTISDRLGRKLTLIITYLWIGLGIALLQFSAYSLLVLVVAQLFAGLATNAIYPVLYAFSSDAAEPGGIGTANSVMLFFFYLGGISPVVLGYFVQIGGGYHDATGYVFGIYFLTAICVLSAILIALFTRETVGIFRDRDRALVSKESCNLAGPPEAASREVV
jgi:MFS family permease